MALYNVKAADMCTSSREIDLGMYTYNVRTLIHVKTAEYYNSIITVLCPHFIRF